MHRRDFEEQLEDDAPNEQNNNEESSDTPLMLSIRRHTSREIIQTQLSQRNLVNKKGEAALMRCIHDIVEQSLTDLFTDQIGLTSRDGNCALHKLLTPLNED